jgi:hypothetical protein
MQAYVSENNDWKMESYDIEAMQLPLVVIWTGCTAGLVAVRESSSEADFRTAHTFANLQVSCTTITGIHTPVHPCTTECETYAVLQPDWGTLRSSDRNFMRA